MEKDFKKLEGYKKSLKKDCLYFFKKKIPLKEKLKKHVLTMSQT